MALKFQRRLVIDSESQLSSENDFKANMDRQNKILNDKNGAEFKAFRKELSNKLNGFMKEDIGKIDARILTGILTPMVSKIDQAENI